MKIRRILLSSLMLILAYTTGFAQVPNQDEIMDQLEDMGIEQQTIQDKISTGEISSGELIDAIEDKQMNLEGSTEFIDPAAEQAKEKAQEKIEEQAEEKKDILEQAEELVEEKEAEEEVGKVDDEEELIIVQAEEEDTYGKKIFRNKTLTLLNQLEDFKAPDTYILGDGDEFSISIWGDTEYSGEFEINEDGYIKPPRMARIYLRGLSYKSAEELIRSNFEKRFNLKNSQIEITLNYSRMITVGIYGEVYQPGSYKISALNSAFNALTAAGGPNENGTVRNITIRRSGQPDKVLDVYKYLEDPSIADEFYLKDNDIIHVPNSEKLVRISGAVKRPLRYEVIPGEGMLDVIDYAGGFGARAYKSNIQIERYGDDEKVLVDVDFKNLLSTGGDKDLLTGDHIKVYDIKKEYENFIKIKGEVEVPGDYQLVNGMRVRDVVSKAGVKDNSRIDRVYIVRREEDLSKKYIRVNLEDVLANPGSQDNIELQPFDVIDIASKSDFEDRYTYNVEGHVRNPGEFTYDEDLKVRDAVFFAKGRMKDAARFGYIQRVDGNDKRKWLRVDLEEAIGSPASSDNQTLMPNDVLVIFPKDRFEDKELNTTITGAVRVPGDFKYSPNMTLSDVVYLAGGLREEAAEGRIEISRLNIDQDKKTEVVIATVGVDRNLVLEGKEGEFKIAPYDQIFVREAPEFEVQQNIQLMGEVVYPGVYTLTDKRETLLSVIQRAGGLTNAAFPKGATLIRTEDSLGQVILNLDRVIKNPESRYNYVLKRGDIITIPKVKDLVSISGAIRYPNIEEVGRISAPYHKGRRAKFYVNKYGAGVDRKIKRGRKNMITVINPNGYVQKTKNYGLFKIYPKVDEGAVVRVDSKLKKDKDMREGEEQDRREWSDLFTTVVSQATAVLTLIILADRTFSNP